MSKIYCSTCKYYDYNTREGVDWCKLNDEETGICGHCEREFEDLDEATEHYDAVVKENNDFLSSNSEMASKVADLEAKLAESEKNLALCEQLRDVEETEYSEDISKTNSALFRKCQQTTRLIEENNQLKQQLAEKDQAIEGLQEINQSLGQTCNSDAKEIERLREKENLLNLIADGYYTPTNIVKRQIREQNQTAIAELNNILDTFAFFVNEKKESMVSPDGNGNLSLLEYVENRIDALKGEK